MEQKRRTGRQGTARAREACGIHIFQGAWICVPGPAAGVASVPLAGKEPGANAVGVMAWRRCGAQAGMRQRVEGKPRVCMSESDLSERCEGCFQKTTRYFLSLKRHMAMRP